MPLLRSMKSRPELLYTGDMFRDMFAKIVLGKVSIEYYDRFIEIWKEQGGDQIVQESTAWYNHHMKSTINR
jgi:putative aldouronate transport system substrate-binding protein